jgi:hypothetical protein
MDNVILGLMTILAISIAAAASSFLLLPWCYFLHQILYMTSASEEVRLLFSDPANGTIIILSPLRSKYGSVKGCGSNIFSKLTIILS